ncbi:hypothetical protein KF913_26040, partial [Candidatus Obscuribacterales bacterium]|nr:hypothetical protein [Candidatus Obscuribacterales bacterium]
MFKAFGKRTTLRVTLSTALGLFLSVFFAGVALAESPVGLLNSQHNRDVYQDQHLGTYDDDYAEFKRTLGGANVRYDELGDVDAAMGREKLSKYDAVIV